MTKVLNFIEVLVKNFLYGEGTPVPVIKQDIGRLKIGSDSESDYDEERNDKF